MVLENQGKSNVLKDSFTTKAGIGKRALPIFNMQLCRWQISK
jgi:hypothetical protein